MKILSGGAAQGLVASLAPQFKQQTGLAIEGEFGAVGAMAGKLRGGTPADIVVLTAALIADLADEKLVVPGSITDVGLVETAIAVRDGDPLVSVHDAASLRAALLLGRRDLRAGHQGLHGRHPCRQGAAATGHCRRSRGPAQDLPERRDRHAPTRASDAVRPIGCTQSTEILNTAGVVLSGSLPKGCELATMYTAAVTTQAADPDMPAT